MKVRKCLFAGACILGLTYTALAPPIPPSIVQDLVSITVVQGSPATFTVGATGHAPLSYQWFFNSTPIAGANDTNYTLASAQFTNAGNYQVLVTNSFGSATSSIATLTVLPAPVTNTLSLGAGKYNLIANQLDHGSNTLNEVLTNLQVCSSCGDTLLLYKYQCQGWQNPVQYFDAVDTGGAPGWYDSGFNASTLTLVPGEGAVIYYQPAGSNSPLTVTFTGTPHVPILPASLACGFGAYNILSRQTNDIGTYQNITGYAPATGAQTLTMSNSASFTFVTNTYLGTNWPLGTPVFGVGQAGMFLVPIPAYTVNIKAGLNLIANQLDHGSNSLNELFTNFPDGSVFYKYNNAGGNWTSSVYSAMAAAWIPSGLTLNPGEGGFLQSPSAFTVTFTGTPHVPVLPISIPSGATYLLSRQTNDIGNYTNIVGLQPTNGTTLSRWNASNSTFTVYVYATNWTPATPSVNVGESIWIGPSPPQGPTNYTVNIPATPGVYLICNQLDHGSNTADVVISNPYNPALGFGPRDFDFIEIFNCAGGAQQYYFDSNPADTPTGFLDAIGDPVPAPLLSPGTGFFYTSESGNSNSITFTGTPHVPVLPVVNALACGYNGFYLLGRQTNDIGNYTNIVGQAPQEGSLFATWNGSVFVTNRFTSGAWVLGQPVLAVGQAAGIHIPAPPCITMTTNSGKTVACGSGWSFDAPTNIVDICCTNFTVTASTVTNSSGCPQVFTRTWLIADSCGNSNTCSQTVTVVDTTPPSLTCASNKIVAVGSSWTFDPPAAIDACSGTNVTIIVLSTVTNGACSQSITRKWSAIDACGNSNTCSQTVTIGGPPVVGSVYNSCGDTNIVIAFTNTVSSASALNLAHYQVFSGTNALSLFRAALNEDAHIVTLATSNAVLSGVTTLSINGVQDSCGNMLTGYQTNFSCSSACNYGSTGPEFWLTFPGNYAPDTNNPPQVQLYISGAAGTIGSVSMPGISPPFVASFTIPVGGQVAVPLPSSADLANANDAIRSNGVHVVASASVTVDAFDHVAFTTDAYLGLPTSTLGTLYMVLGYKNVFSGVPELNGTQFALVASQDNTVVTIVPSSTVGSHNSGLPFNISLMRGQTYQLRNTNNLADLTGTTISSSLPIAVFGGHQCADIPSSNVFFCDYVVEQLLPTSLWGTDFLTAPLATRSIGDTFRCLALQGNTTVFTNGISAALLSQGNVAEFQLKNAAHITATKPILVAQYANSSDFDGVVNADPLMMLVMPTAMYATSYQVATPQTNYFPGTSNFLNITAPTAAVGQVVLDGSAIPAASFFAIGSSGYSEAQVPVTAIGLHSLHASNGLAFGVEVYGWSLYDAYGYPGGFCSSQPVSPPQFTCPTNNPTIQAVTNCLAPVPDLTTQVGNGTNAVLITQTPPAGTLVGPGTYPISLTIIDGFGNQHLCGNTLTVTPGNSPGLVCPPTITVSAPTSAGVAVSFAASLCNTNFALSYSPPSGSVFRPGTNNVLVNASSGGVVAQFCNFSVIVKYLSISATSVSNRLQLNWTTGAVLQRATTLSGPWTTVTNVSSPYSPPTTGTQGYFRVAE